MSKGFGKKFKNISDTNLLLTITMVVIPLAKNIPARVTIKG